MSFFSRLCSCSCSCFGFFPGARAAARSSSSSDLKLEANACDNRVVLVDDQKLQIKLVLRALTDRNNPFVCNSISVCYISSDQTILQLPNSKATIASYTKPAVGNEDTVPVQLIERLCDELLRGAVVLLDINFLGRAFSGRDVLNAINAHFDSIGVDSTSCSGDIVLFSTEPYEGIPYFLGKPLHDTRKETDRAVEILGEIFARREAGSHSAASSTASEPLTPSTSSTSFGMSPATSGDFTG